MLSMSQDEAEIVDGCSRPCASMDGVDTTDQQIMYYSCGHKGINIWRRITGELPCSLQF